MGRPKTDIDWDKVAKMIMAGADGVQCAAYFGIAPDTIYLRCEQDNNIGFSHFLRQKRAKGDAMLLAAQFDAALTDKNTTMLVWLGKQRLGQTEKQQTDITSNGKTIHITLPTKPEE